VGANNLPRQGRRRNPLTNVGLTPRQRRGFDALVAGVVALFGASWVIAVVNAVTVGGPRPAVAELTRNPLSSESSPLTPRLLDAAMQKFVARSALRGHSGQVRIIVHGPGETLPDTALGEAIIEYASTTDTVRALAPPPGVWNVVLRIKDSVREVPDLKVLSMVPLTEKRNGRIGQYLVGNWPNERGGTPRSPIYAPPRGMIRVTPENLDVPISRHFKLRHFVTKGQENVWPKYVLISPKVLDKVELTIDELKKTGTPVNRVGVISGFRTPTYNAGGGDTSGRGALSRHMYGDALDWFVDNNGDGRMDDLNGDGRIDINDGRVIVKAAESVERQYPDMVGGIGLYSPTGAHSGFVHLDTRGTRARW
jgi:uncharacterized protein YcbK (DUF882 family)